MEWTWPGWQIQSISNRQQLARDAKETNPACLYLWGKTQAITPQIRCGQYNLIAHFICLYALLLLSTPHFILSWTFIRLVLCPHWTEQHNPGRATDRIRDSPKWKEYKNVHIEHYNRQRKRSISPSPNIIKLYNLLASRPEGEQCVANGLCIHLCPLHPLKSLLHHCIRTPWLPSCQQHWGNHWMSSTIQISGV